MRVALTGASGFIGRAVAERLKASGHTVTPVSLRTAPRPEAFAGCEAIVHLAGEPVAQRWTAPARERILNSRVQGTRSVVNAIREQPPRVLMSASAIGYYGSRGDEILTEESPPGSDFLSEVTVAWEREARVAETFGVRVVTPRVGVVLGRAGGALGPMALPFRWGVGGRIGSGKQWLSWIALDDLVSLIEFLLESPAVRGPVNAVAPNPLTNAEFTRELAATLHRPAIIPVPAIALELLLGDMSQMLLGSQRVIPQAALRAGFTFRFPEAGAALRQILAS